MGGAYVLDVLEFRVLGFLQSMKQPSSLGTGFRLRVTVRVPMISESWGSGFGVRAQG